MKILYLIILSIFITVMFVLLAKTPEVISIFVCNKYTDEDGKPSRNNEKDHDCNLYLYKDKTFKMIGQNGHLAPKYETKSGTWEIVNEELVLHINKIKASDNTVINKNQNDICLMNGTVVLKRNLKQGFSDGVSNWEYRQGLKPEELFIKYINASSTANPQGFDSEKFAAKINFSIELINKQPARKTLSMILSKGFTLNSLNEFEYYFKYMGGETVIAHLDHLDSKRIAYVEIFEKMENLKDMNSFINKKYSFFAGEHNCFYYNDKKISILVIPLQEIIIQVSKYDL